MGQYSYNCIEIVIARYKEDLSWLPLVLEELANSTRLPPCSIVLFVYNKGPEPYTVSPNISSLASHVHVQPLLNVGRESHTYLHHIVSRYEAYASPEGSRTAVLFLQGDPTDHLPQWYKEYDGLGSLLESFLLDTQSWGASLTFAKEHEYVEHFAAHYSFNIERHNGIPVHPRVGKPFGVWFQEHVGGGGAGEAGATFREGQLLRWWIAVLFCVHASRLVQARSRDSYQQLLGCVDRDVDPEAGHYFERAWVYVTGAHLGLPEWDAAHATAGTVGRGGGSAEADSGSGVVGLADPPAQRQT